jgi:hypothetical protein
MDPVGTPLSFAIEDMVSHAPLVGVKATLGDSSALSDAKGILTLTVPPQAADVVTVSIAADAYNQQNVTAKLSESNAVAVKMVPSGKLYFLSKASGKIDVVKTNLDGTDRKVVLAGTGRENDQSTVLVATRDWKYLLLKARREGANEALYLIDTHDDTMIAIDKTPSLFTLSGWQGHKFVYLVESTSIDYSGSGHWAVKSYNADATKLSVVDQTQESSGGPANYQTLSAPVVIQDAYVYTRYWVNGGPSQTGDVVKVDQKGSKSTLKSFQADQYSGINILSSGQDEVYVGIYGTASKVYEYNQAHFKESTLSYNDLFSSPYVAKLVSPNGSSTLWAEDRDGKKTLLVGDEHGSGGKEVLRQDEYAAFGWFGDDYVLLSKNGSELYIASSKMNPLQPIKISDYHKPTSGLPYGYGYGG